MERHRSRTTSPNALDIARGDRRRSAADAELARLREIEQAALEFCARCERGEIRSVHSYERFRAALAGRGCAAA